MKILIDTHIAIWAVLNDPKLPSKAENIMFLTDDSLIPQYNEPFIISV